MQSPEAREARPRSRATFLWADLDLPVTGHVVCSVLVVQAVRVMVNADLRETSKVRGGRAAILCCCRSE